MEDGQAFKLIMGFIMLMVTFLLWIPLNEVVGQAADIFNGINTTNETYNEEMIERNNIVKDLFGAFMVILFIVYGIWAMKPGKDKKYEQ